jgi:hypothetical protein
MNESINHNNCPSQLAEQNSHAEEVANDATSQKRAQLTETSLSTQSDLLEPEDSVDNPVNSEEAKFFLSRINSLTATDELRGLITQIALTTNLKGSNLTPSEAVVLIKAINSKTTNN